MRMGKEYKYKNGEMRRLGT